MIMINVLFVIVGPLVRIHCYSEFANSETNDFLFFLHAKAQPRESCESKYRVRSVQTFRCNIVLQLVSNLLA